MIFNALMAVTFALIAMIYLSRLFFAISKRKASWRSVDYHRSEQPTQYRLFFLLLAFVGMTSALCAIALGHSVVINLIGRG